MKDCCSVDDSWNAYLRALLAVRERHTLDLDVIEMVARLRDRANQASVNS